MIFFVIAILLCVAMIYISGKIIVNLRFRTTVKQLFALSSKISDQKFTYSQLIGLPEPVQRYFKLVLTENQTYVSYARITHDGQFKTGIDKAWINIKGEQYATTQRPGFIWKGETSFFTAIDQYIEDKGSLTVSILSLFRVVNGKGPTFNSGELLRWLGESVMYPTNLLPSDRLKWTPIDATSARFSFNYKELSLCFLATFNGSGAIIRLETDRYMDETHLEKWVITMGSYKNLNGISIPTTFEVTWALPAADFTYAKFNIQKIEYNTPRSF